MSEEWIGWLGRDLHASRSRVPWTAVLTGRVEGHAAAGQGQWGERIAFLIWASELKAWSGLLGLFSSRYSGHQARPWRVPGWRRDASLYVVPSLARPHPSNSSACPSLLLLFNLLQPASFQPTAWPFYLFRLAVAFRQF